MSADGDSDREVEAIMQAEGRGSPVASYGSLGASYGSSRAESSLIDCGSSGGRGHRPPSSYGSMKSDDAPDDDCDDPQDFKPPPSVVVTVSTRRLQVHRADSPETTFTEATNALTYKSAIPKEGLHLNETSRDRSSEMIEEEEEQKSSEARGGEEDEDEDMEPRGPPTPPPQPPQPPAEGLGLQFGPTHPQLSLPFLFKSLQSVLSQLSLMELTWFKRSVAQRNRGKVDADQLMECDVLDLVDYLIEHFGQGGGIKLAVTTLHLIDRRQHAEDLEGICRRVLIRHELQEHHKRHYEVVFEGVARPGEQAALKRIFTGPVLVEGGHRGVNTEHEILRGLRPANGAPRRSFHLNDVLRESLTESGRVRVAVLSGAPMIGLSYAAYRLALDWSHEATNQDLHFFFYLTCQDLRHYVESSISLVRLLSVFHHALDGITPLLKGSDTPSVLLLEGWEERRPIVDMSAPPISDLTQEAPLSHLLASLIRGDLLPHVRIIITCRRSDLPVVPLSYVDRLLEVRGFLPEHRDEFFLKHYDRDPSVGPQVLSQVKRSPTLYAMSHLPLFAWIVAYIFERNVRRKPSFVTRPPHETVFYVDMVLVMVSRWQERYLGSSPEHSRWRDSDKSMLMRLGRFALKLTEARRTCFHGDELKEHELDLHELLHLGMFTEELPDWTQGRGAIRGVAVAGGGVTKSTYVFVHMHLQEFMAAFYVYLMFRNEGRNVFEQQLKSSVVSKLVKDRPILDLLRPVLDRALASPDGHLDLLLRFLCGLAMDSTEDHLRGTMLPHRNPPPRGMDDADKHIRKRMDSATAERRSNLERCLNEMKELKEDIQEPRAGF